MRSLLLLCAVVLCITVCDARKRPNVLFIVADDLGYSDVGYHHSDLPTPNIDAFAATGIKLENYYVQYLCTPARSSVMTGRYPIRYGLQHRVIQAPQPHGLNLTEVTMAQKFREAGYSTHAIGKWHLGFFDARYTPINRGFDDHFGFWCGEQDYYYHTETWDGYTGYDLRNNSEVYRVPNGTFIGTLFEQEAIKIINSTTKRSKPWFMWLALQTPHSPLDPRLTNDQYCSTVIDPVRRLFCGLLARLDITVGNIRDALTRTGVLKDTLVIFSTDNGGWNVYGGYNVPFRGGKFTNWEGGVKGVGFIAGKGVPHWKRGTTYNGLMHLVDWYPTLMRFVHGNTAGSKPLDGFDQWKAITRTGISPRNEILHNIDELENNQALRRDDWKLIIGQQLFDGYFCPQNVTQQYCPHTVVNSTCFQTQNNTYLFNIRNDPKETCNLADKYPQKVAELTARINFYRQGGVPALNPPDDPASDPKLHGGVWSVWR